MNYFNSKAFEILNHVLHGPEFYSADDVDAVALALKEVARDQRHACAEECAGSDEHIAAASHYHGLAMNARIEHDAAEA